ncbi:MAG: redoxin domain-containing protein [Thermoanaerobaculia bacterium]|nr:redoxin domain-containing protein [Thermoanaerobaculia bacterium]
MAEGISTGDVAPDFDLSSTESALLMLRDEVGRKSVLLYVFADAESEAVRRDLAALAERREALAKAHAKVLAMAPLKMPVLQALQAELRLPFPLLRDDRDFLAQYGVVAEEGETPAPALFLIDSGQVVVWMARPVSGVASAFAEVEPLLATAGSPTANYPKTVINRLVDRWVN